MAKKVMTVVGARPQFIKASVISRELESRDDLHEILIHTGQHFDNNMSQIFFDELEIPAPKANLGISGGSHAEMTGAMMVALEKAMKDERPDVVLLYGDTNSTLAGALSAAKLGIPFCHAEAGARTGSRENPEEINRICTDHLASCNCAPTPTCYDNLVHEGLEANSSFTGDLMYDAFRIYSDIAKKTNPILKGLEGGVHEIGAGFCYLTCHRQENTSESKLRELFEALRLFDADVIYPVHPRMQELVMNLKEELPNNRLLLVNPVGYLESLLLLDRCSDVITDSGGLQREAFFAEKKCVTLLPFSSAQELLVDQRNTVVKNMDKNEILSALEVPQTIDEGYTPFGDGHAALEIISQLIRL